MERVGHRGGVGHGPVLDGAKCGFDVDAFGVEASPVDGEGHPAHPSAHHAAHREREVACAVDVGVGEGVDVVQRPADGRGCGVRACPDDREDRLCGT